MQRLPHVSLEFKRLSIPDKVVFGDKVVADLTANAETFNNLPIPAVGRQTVNDTLSSSAQAAAGGDHQKITAMHQAKKAWEVTFDTEAHYVDGVGNGDKNIIRLAGFNATETETKPATKPDAVKFHVVAANPLSGSIHIEVDLAANAVGYIYFISSDNNLPVFTNNQFSLSDNPKVIAFIIDTHRKVDFYNLPSKQAYL